MNDEQKKHFKKMKEKYSKQLTDLEGEINVAANILSRTAVSRLRTQTQRFRLEFKKFIATADIAGAFLSDDDRDPCSDVSCIDLVTSNQNKVA